MASLSAAKTHQAPFEFLLESRIADGLEQVAERVDLITADGVLRSTRDEDDDDLGVVLADASGHPDGAAAGVQSIRDAWRAAGEGVPLPVYAETRPALAHALAFYG